MLIIMVSSVQNFQVSDYSYFSSCLLGIWAERM